MKRVFLSDNTVEAHKMAIKALEQEPCEDCISRQTVLDVIEREQFKGDAISEIEKLPPVTPQPKTGHWIWCVGSHKCSNCEEYTCFSHTKLLRYYPNCGARMVEPQEGGDKG